MLRVMQQPFRPQETGDEVEVVARCPHRDGKRATTDTDLQRLLTDERVHALGAVAAVDAQNTAPRGHPAHTVIPSVASVSSPMTGYPGSSPATSNPPDVCASASKSCSISESAERSAYGATHSRLRRVPPGMKPS